MCSEPSLARQIILLLEQVKMQSNELKIQLQNNTALLQILVGRNGGSHVDVALPDDLQLPCTTLVDLQHV
jgi:hypothetical protein